MSAITTLAPNQVQNPVRTWTVSGQGLQQQFGPKYPSEKQLLQFLFAQDLTSPNVIKTGVPPTVSVTCIAGNDPNPQALLAGPPTVDSTNTIVSVPIQGGLPEAQYIIEVNVTTNIPTISPTVAGMLTIGYP